MDREHFACSHLWKDCLHSSFQSADVIYCPGERIANIFSTLPISRIVSVAAQLRLQCSFQETIILMSVPLSVYSSCIYQEFLEKSNAAKDLRYFIMMCSMLYV